MTRKRFIKLVMSKGYQRNNAQIIAGCYCMRKIPYKKAYREFLIKQGLALSTKSMANSFNMLSDNLKKVTTQLSKLKENMALRKYSLY